MTSRAWKTVEIEVDRWQFALNEGDKMGGVSLNNNSFSSNSYFVFNLIAIKPSQLSLFAFNSLFSAKEAVTFLRIWPYGPPCAPLWKVHSKLVSK